MAFVIYPTRDLCNKFGMESKTVDNLVFDNGFIVVNDYRIPSNKIRYIKEVQ